MVSNKQKNVYVLIMGYECVEGVFDDRELLVEFYRDLIARDYYDEEYLLEIDHLDNSELYQELIDGTTGFGTHVDIYELNNPSSHH